MRLFNLSIYLHILIYRKNIIIPCIARESLARDMYNQIKQNEAEHIVCVLRFWIISEGKGILLLIFILIFIMF